MSAYTLVSFPRLVPLLIDTVVCVATVDNPRIASVPGASPGVVGAVTYGSRPTAVLDLARLLPPTMQSTRAATRANHSLLMVQIGSFTCGLVIEDAEIYGLPIGDARSWPLAADTAETGFLRVPPEGEIAPSVAWLDMAQVLGTLGAAGS